MPRYIALLRGINVGGNRLIRMEDLRAMAVTAGATEIETYIQSGNLVFTHAGRSQAKVARELEVRIATATGFDVPIVLRSAAEWGRVIADNPFVDAPADHLHVYFVAFAPRVDALAAITAPPPERCQLVGREVYLCLPNGLGNSRLAGAVAKVGALAGATARNWRTVQQLQSML